MGATGLEVDQRPTTRRKSANLGWAAPSPSSAGFFEFASLPFDSVQLEWVSAPGFGPEENVIPLGEMAKYPILTQTQGSGLQKLVLLGVTFLTASYFGPEIRQWPAACDPHRAADPAAALLRGAPQGRHLTPRRARCGDRPAILRLQRPQPAAGLMSAAVIRRAGR